MSRDQAPFIPRSPDDAPVPFEIAITLALNQGEESAWTYVARDGRRFPVLLTVNAKPTLDGARQVVVHTTTSEVDLRYRAWIEERRQALS